MHHRLSLRTVVLAAVAVGAVLVPSTTAFADSAPASPAPSVEPSAAAARAGATTAPTPGAEPSVVPRGGVAAGDSPAPAVERPAAAKRSAGAAPRGGVAAGERPAGTSGDSTTALAGSATAALLVAGAGTFVLRRRSAAQQGR
ncbi:hypothetical protein [Streptomyces sp. NPDC002785]|uniref:hypothetical protein n=1 Tax=Streptomyces sp. NPDC002785 TaxID=3154543 RepID=UPI0033180EDB